MKRRVLLLYYSFTNQTRRVADEIEAGFVAAGWDVARCEIELVDPRYVMDFPLQPFWQRLFRWIPPQITRRTGAIDFPRETLDRPYDLVCVGSPTWWLHPALPIVSFLRTDAARELLEGRPVAVFAVCRAFWWNNVRQVRRLAVRCGARYLGGAGFGFRGNQLQTFATFVNYLQTGRDRDRYWRLKIHPYGIPAEGLQRAREFATHLAQRIDAAPD